MLKKILVSVAALFMCCLSVAPAFADISHPSDYILGGNDELQVSVYGQPDMSSKTRIKSDGTVVLPLIGAVPAIGKTTSELGNDIANRLRTGGYLNTPSVTVEITTYASRVVTVLGNVLTPGIYPIDNNQTVAMMIARAGGVRADGANAVFINHANDAAKTRVSLTDFGSDNSGMPLKAGDTLFVPPAEQIFVYGQVNVPGGFPLQSGMTYRQALARAGGPTLAGTARRFVVHRGDKKLSNLNLDDPAQPNDVIYIKEKLF